MASFSSGSDRVQDFEFNDVLAILEGPSPWREYIRTNLAIARTKISSSSFRIVSSDKFDAVLSSLNMEDPKAVGVTNKQTGEITMKEWGLNSGRSYLLAVLHECVHMVSDPAAQGRAHSTAYGQLGGGLLEGMVECVAEDILTSQRLPLPSADSGMLGYADGVSAIARELLTNFSVPFFARVLFQGNGDQLLAVMNFIYSSAGWAQAKSLISAGRIRDARDLMTRMRADEDDKRNKALRATQQQIQQQVLAKKLHDIILHLP